jgi:preprotein translocase subunit Sec61beta
MKWSKRKSDYSRGPSSSLGLLSFSESSKSLIRVTPEMVLVGAVVFGLLILFLNIFL